MRVSFVFMYKDMAVSIRGDKKYSPLVDIEKMDIEYIDCEPLSNDEFHAVAQRALSYFDSLKLKEEKNMEIINKFPDIRETIYILYKTISEICDSIHVKPSDIFLGMKKNICQIYETK